MADQIQAITAIGKLPGAKPVEPAPPLLGRVQAPAPDTGARQPSMREGAPVDVVELSMDPETVRQLPPSLYLKFLVDQKDGQVIVQVMDSATDEIVRVVPSNKLQEALRGLRVA